jgi:hypothetical protein
MKTATPTTWRQLREFQAKPSEFASKPSDLNSDGLPESGGVP